MADEYIRRAEALEITTRTCGDYAAAYAEIWSFPPPTLRRWCAARTARTGSETVGLTVAPNGHCFEHDIDTNGRDSAPMGSGCSRRSGKRRS